MSFFFNPGFDVKVVKVVGDVCVCGGLKTSLLLCGLVYLGGRRSCLGLALACCWCCRRRGELLGHIGHLRTRRLDFGCLFFERQELVLERLGISCRRYNVLFNKLSIHVTLHRLRLKSLNNSKIEMLG